MAIRVEKARGLSKEEALLEATTNGLMVVIQNTEEGESEETHWHRWDTHLYLVEGEFRNLDPENPRLVLEPGDYCVIEKETLHAGVSAKPCTLVVSATPEVLDGVTIFEDPATLHQ